MAGVSKGIITGETGLIKAAQRQEKHRAAMIAAGYVQLNVWVPADQVADLKEMCKAMREDDDLAVGPCLSKETRRLTSWRNRGDD